MNSVTLKKVVKPHDLASVVKSGSLDVLATPIMIAWMEEAACACLELEPGQTSVGIAMNVTHDKASPVGAEVEVTATIVNVDRKKISYEVKASCNGQMIGQGAHDRFIVDAKRFMDKLNG